MKSVMMIGAAALLSLTAVANVHAGDPALGKTAYNTCLSCHGAQGQGVPPTFPALKGMSAEEVVTLLKAYRANEVDSPMAGLMVPNATGLSDDDINNLAAYIATF